MSKIAGWISRCSGLFLRIHSREHVSTRPNIEPVKFEADSPATVNPKPQKYEKSVTKSAQKSRNLTKFAQLSLIWII